MMDSNLPFFSQLPAPFTQRIGAVPAPSNPTANPNAVTSIWATPDETTLHHQLLELNHLFNVTVRELQTKCSELNKALEREKTKVHQLNQQLEGAERYLEQEVNEKVKDYQVNQSILRQSVEDAQDEANRLRLEVERMKATAAESHVRKKPRPPLACCGKCHAVFHENRELKQQLRSVEEQSYRKLLELKKRLVKKAQMDRT